MSFFCCKFVLKKTKERYNHNGNWDWEKEHWTLLSALVFCHSSTMMWPRSWRFTPVASKLRVCKAWLNQIERKQRERESKRVKQREREWNKEKESHKQYLVVDCLPHIKFDETNHDSKNFFIYLNILTNLDVFQLQIRHNRIHHRYDHLAWRWKWFRLLVWWAITINVTCHQR